MEDKGILYKNEVLVRKEGGSVIAVLTEAIKFSKLKIGSPASCIVTSAGIIILEPKEGKQRA